MAKCYIELRKSAARGTDSIAADVMRHLHTREHLGKAVIVTERPLAMLAASRKQWLKISRAIQKQRASTLNADKILKYTHTIIHMQHMHFSAKSPLEQPDADIYFMRPSDLVVMPVQCWTAYVLCPIRLDDAEILLVQAPTEALVVDYLHAHVWHQLGLAPKKTLESYVADEWHQVRQFLETHGITIEQLSRDDTHDVDAMDDALDTLLGVSHKFLQIAQEFQRALELARPIRINKETRILYDTLVLLAHRVQALSPGVFTQRFLETYNEDDMFFLYDHRRSSTLGAELLADAFARHMSAGRVRLAHALRLHASAISYPSAANRQ